MIEERYWLRRIYVACLIGLVCVAIVKPISIFNGVDIHGPDYEAEEKVSSMLLIWVLLLISAFLLRFFIEPRPAFWVLILTFLGTGFAVFIGVLISALTSP